MKEYRKILKFKYKNNYYNMYLDNENKHFFLRITDNNQLSYVTFEELFELTNIFTNDKDRLCIEFTESNEKLRLIPKVLKGGIAVVLSATMLTGCISEYNASIDNNTETTAVSLVDEETANNYISNSEETKEFIVDTYRENKTFNYTYVYDMDYLDYFFDSQNITLDSLYETIDSNNNIPDKYKDIIKEYCQNVYQTYPNIEYRVLYENLKTLEIIEMGKDDINDELDNNNTYGYYNREENKIYVDKDLEYEKGSWAYQVIFHELTHCLRTGIYDINGKEITVQAEGRSFHNKITLEALNSLFAVSVLDYEEDTIAYQLQSNYFNIMLECMDNYDLSDYINHSESYFVKKLDEYNNDNNYAATILELMQAQYVGFYNNEIEVEQSEYYPIYDYISKMYYDKYITDDMTYDEMEAVAEKLIQKIALNTPEDFNIDYDRFYQNLSDYYSNMENNKTKKSL